MPKRKPTDLPKILSNKKGEYYCNINGRQVYLGRNATTAKMRLLSIISQQQPVMSSSPNVTSCLKTPQPTRLTSSVSVVELAEFYLDTRNGKSHYDKSKVAAQTIIDMYAFCAVCDFGPLALQRCRNKWIADGLTRDYINRLTREIVNMFKYGVATEIVPVNTAAMLAYVNPLQAGEARDALPRQEVPDKDILLTLPFLLPTVRDMVVLQRISGARPSEIFRMTLNQFVQRDGNVWVYVPSTSKTQRYGSRVLAFGTYEIDILQRHAMGRKPNDLLFTTWDTWRERCERMGRNCTSRPSRMSGAYNRSSYLHHISRSIDAANEHYKQQGEDDKIIKHWTPYQLRHSSATFISLVTNQDVAATILGHRSTATTKRYDHSAVAKAIKAVHDRDKACPATLQTIVDATRDQ